VVDILSASDTKLAMVWGIEKPAVRLVICIGSNLGAGKLWEFEP
jgi:hypothetical protein